MTPKPVLLVCRPGGWNFGLFVALSASSRICARIVPATCRVLSEHHVVVGAERAADPCVGPRRGPERERRRLRCTRRD